LLGGPATFVRDNATLNTNVYNNNNNNNNNKSLSFFLVFNPGDLYYPGYLKNIKFKKKLL